MYEMQPFIILITYLQNRPFTFFLLSVVLCKMYFVFTVYLSLTLSLCYCHCRFRSRPIPGSFTSTLSWTLGCSPTSVTFTAAFAQLTSSTTAACCSLSFTTTALCWYVHIHVRSPQRLWRFPARVTVTWDQHLSCVYLPLYPETVTPLSECSEHL